MGGAVSIERLIIDSGDRLVGTSQSVGGSEALDDSPGPEVLAFLAEGSHTELSGHEVVAPRIVGGLLVLY